MSRTPTEDILAQRQARNRTLNRITLLLVPPVTIFCVLAVGYALATNPERAPQMAWICLGGIAAPFLFILVVLLILAGFSPLIERVADRRTRQRYPPPGRLVDVGGHKLHVECMGEGGPTVILEGGSGMSLDWRLVQAKVAGFTHVCSYDRAGFGWSEEGPGPRSPEKLAEELAALLQAAEVPGPYILVAQDGSAVAIRLLAARIPDQVAGLVLVNARHEDEAKELFPAVWMKYPAWWLFLVKIVSLPFNWVVRWWLSLRMSFYRLGLFRPNTALPYPYDHLPPESHAAYLALITRPNSWQRTNKEESRLLEAVLAQEGQLPRALPDVPLVVLVRGIYEGAKDLPAGTPYDKLRKLWLAMQTELAQRVPNHKLVVAAHSTRHIHLEQPDLVVEAIKAVFEAVHTGQALSAMSIGKGQVDEAMITRQVVSEKILAYLNEQITLEALVDWAKDTVGREDVEPDEDSELLMDILTYLAATDSPEFPLDWDVSVEFLRRLGVNVKAGTA